MLSDLKIDEPGRMRALHRLDILDTESEAPFERIVEHVRQVLDVPMSAVSLVDHDRQWLKAHRGDLDQVTPRAITFCNHAIMQSTPFVVSDACADVRFAQNPLVTGAPRIRSYAGIPLTSPEGYNLGSLCAIDTRPRAFSAHDMAVLANFAKVVVKEIELRKIVSTDPLTGAMSRRAWFECAEAELAHAARHGRALSIMVLDIDHFKSVNDVYGHPVGDLVLHAIARTIAETLRQSDAFGRFGGEEFVAISRETALDDAVTVAERVRAAVRSVHLAPLNGRHCSVSIGVAERLPHEQQISAVLTRADEALYCAKRTGRDRVCAASMRIAQVSTVA